MAVWRPTCEILLFNLYLFYSCNFNSICIKTTNFVLVIKEEILDESNKSVALKLLEEYDESNDSQSDNEAPEEMAIVKKCSKQLTECTEEQCPTLETRAVSIEHNKEVVNTAIVEENSGSVKSEANIDVSPKVNEECENTNNVRGLKRKKTQKKEIKPIKKNPPLRTPRTEMVERKGALLEAVS